ncbi:MAG TPA: GntR family transcriptional regulator [Candidatus Limnocylindrales bacterium]
MALRADEELTPLARSVLSAQVKDKLLRWILEGELPPGSRVIETRVARRLGTSQAPVREALRDLATLGLVEMHPFRGARVRQPAAEELIEAMEVRGELEAIAARQAARAVDETTLREMRALIDRMRLCADAGDAHGQALANSEFHTLVINASGNRTVQRLWEILEPFARTYLTATVPGADLHWLAERHVAIVDALESRDSERAAEQMRVHARQAEETVERNAAAV